MIAIAHPTHQPRRNRDQRLLVRRRKRWRQRLLEDRQALRQWRCLAKLAQRSVARYQARIERLERWLSHVA
jgi:hypothetical protein